jgi:hypothetical protein
MTLGPGCSLILLTRKKEYNSSNDNTCQGILTEGEGLKQLTSSLR